MTARRLLGSGALLLLTLLLVAVGLRAGSFETDWPTLAAALFRYDAAQPAHYAVVNLRLPRLLLAFLTGGALALSGYLMQTVINNPLADPYILGTASGAALGANVAFFGLVPLLAGGFFLPPLLAFGGATVVTGLATALAWRGGRIVPTQLLLAGVALSTLCGSLISLLTFLSDSEGKLRNIVFWLLGSFERARWEMLPLPAAVLAGSVGLFVVLSRQLQTLLLGEGRAAGLGVRVETFRRLMLGVAALATAVVVAAAGPIGFVGLMVPHAVRGVFGPVGRWNVLITAWAGGLFTLACDLLARWAYPPAGLPVGIITSFLGIPFFVYLLAQKKYRFE